MAVADETISEADSLVLSADIGERSRNPERTAVAERLHQVARARVNPMYFLLAGFAWAFLLMRRGLRSAV